MPTFEQPPVSKETFIYFAKKDLGVSDQVAKEMYKEFIIQFFVKQLEEEAIENDIIS